MVLVGSREIYGSLVFSKMMERRGAIVKIESYLYSKIFLWHLGPLSESTIYFLIHL